MTIYAMIWDGDARAVKIGYTGRQVDDRKKDLQCGHWDDLVCLASVDGSESDEKELHRRFAALRIRGDREWFRIEGDVLEWMRANKTHTRVWCGKCDRGWVECSCSAGRKWSTSPRFTRRSSPPADVHQIENVYQRARVAALNDEQAVGTGTDTDHVSPVSQASPKTTTLERRDIPPTRRQSDIHAFMLRHQEQTGRPARMRDICAEFGIRSTNGVSDHLKAMLSKGMVRRDGMHYIAMRLDALRAA